MVNEINRGLSPVSSVDIRLFGSYAVVQVADALPEPVEHLDGLERRERYGAGFHDRVNTGTMHSIWPAKLESKGIRTRSAGRC